ncbi:ABC transporter ATP-binding protein [Clostridium sp.]|uniref:ABC transporter ATP-binding protein n=1 Tax=Clostridium sp. TaxID=1506 RepID=UPI0032171CC7
MKNNLVAKSIKRVLRNNIVLFISLIFVIVGVVVCTLIPPQLLKVIIDKHLVNGNANGLLNIAIAYLAVLIFIGVFEFIKEGLLVVLGQKIIKEIRREMMCKLERISTSYFSNNESGIIVSRFTNDVDTINSLFTNGIVGMIIDCFKILGIIASIWIFSTQLGVITLCLLPIIFIITRTFQKLMLKAQIRNLILVGKVNNHISESLKNIRMIKAYSKEKYMEDKYKDYITDNFKTIEKINYFDSVYSPIMQIIRAIAISLIVLLSSKQFSYISISLGMAAASIDLISNLFSPIENLGMELQSIQKAVSGMKRVNDFYLEKEDEEKNELLRVNEIIPNRKEIFIGFNNVSFHYVEGVNVLENISLNIDSLEKATFIGRTGVGKSTLFKLIMGLLKPSQGTITINGVDVYSISNNEKRKIFGYVDQNFSFIKGSIADQISLQDKKITSEDIAKSVEFVGLHDYVMSLEKGYETFIENDNLFSQGQKQLLAIARAIVTNPPILLLDEITANLDSITEEKVIWVLQRASDSRTILSISHRLSSMIAADKVIILEDGRIKNIGSPNELLEKDQWYSHNIKLEKLTWG